MTEHGLLCEACGYRLAGLQGESRMCPECGKPLEASLPANRPGSGWQRSPGVGSWLASGWCVLMRPYRTFRALAVDGSTDRLLLWCNLLLGALLHAVAIAVLYRAAYSVTALTIAGLVLLVPAALAALRLLTWIEESGIRFFGTRRGWRISKPVAYAVCSHASYGWVIGGLLMLVGGLSGLLISDAFPNRSLGGWRPLVQLAVVWMPVLGMLGGLLVFETLVYIGMHACRFANGRADAAMVEHGPADVQPVGA